MGASLEYLAGAPAIVVVLLKITLVLAAAWILHGALGHANPRWRVWLWRTTIVGLAWPAVWACGLPVWNWTVATTMRPAIADANGARRVAPSPQSDQPGEISLPHDMAIAPTMAAPADVDGPGRANGDAKSVVASIESAPATLSVPEQFATSPFNRNWGDWLRGIWLAVALVLFGRLIAQVWTVARMVRRSTRATEDIDSWLFILAAEFGIKRDVDVRESVEIQSPLLTGLLRPVIVLPRTLARESDAAALRMMLGHELAHVAGRDLWWALCLRCATMLLWFHPLMWRAGRAHRLACETVADGLVARFAGPTAYVRLLARLALAAHCGRRWESGVAMLATSEITRRLRQLETLAEVGRLSPSRRATAVLALCANTVVISGLRISAGHALMPAEESVATDQLQTTSTTLAAIEPGAEPGKDETSTAKDAARDMSTEQIKAVRKGLEFIANAQTDDGAFVAENFSRKSVGLTAICALALYRGGEFAPERSGERLRSAIEFITSTQDHDGFFDGDRASMYDHGFATWFLAEMQASENWRAFVRQPLERAVELIHLSQHADGGWGYQPHSEDAWADLSQTACQLRALAAARTCGIEVSNETLRKGLAYLSACQSASGAFTYTPNQGAGRFSCTAEAMSAMHSVGATDATVLDRGTTALTRYTAHTRHVEPTWEYYGYFFAADALRLAKDDRRQEWFARIRTQLVKGQAPNGSWGESNDPVGPAFSTALAILILLSEDKSAPGPEPGGAD